jgi:hypothetical protein
MSRNNRSKGTGRDKPLEKLNGKRDEGGKKRWDRPQDSENDPEGSSQRIQKRIKKGTGMSVRRRRDGTALRIQKRIERGETDEGFRLPERSTLAMRIIGTSAACRK